jgi:sensor domain CHASE-containing protein
MAQRPSLTAPNISLRRRTLLFSAASVLLAIALIAAFSYVIVVRSFMRLEEQQSLENMQRARGAFDQHMERLRITSQEWAHWDATYEFVADRNLSYITSNLSNDTFATLGMDVVLILDKEGHIIFQKAYSEEAHAEVPLPAGMRDHLISGNLLIFHPNRSSEHTGVLMLPSGPLLVSSYPILDSLEQGPIRGTFIWAERFDDSITQSLSDTVVLPLEFHPIESDPLIGDLLLGFEAANSDPDRASVQYLSYDSLAAYSIIDDVYGKPALVTRIVMPRTIYQAGLTTFFSILGAVTAVALMIGLFTTLQLERSVLARVEQLRQALHQIVTLIRVRV